MFVQNSSSLIFGTRRENKLGIYQKQALTDGAVVMVPKDDNLSDLKKEGDLTIFQIE